MGLSVLAICDLKGKVRLSSYHRSTLREFPTLFVDTVEVLCCMT